MDSLFSDIKVIETKVYRTLYILCIIIIKGQYNVSVFPSIKKIG